MENISYTHKNSGVVIEVRRGSLLDQNDLDAIVNAQNRHMRGGRGINGAIHERAGEKLMEELQRKAPKGCPTSGVVVTDGYDTGFKKIFHTPGPIWEDGESGEELALEACYSNVLTAANFDGIESLGFCSISTGIFGYPLESASLTALRQVRQWLDLPHDFLNLQRIVFAMYGAEEFEQYKDVLELHIAFDA